MKFYTVIMQRRSFLTDEEGASAINSIARTGSAGITGHRVAVYDLDMRRYADATIVNGEVKALIAHSGSCDESSSLTPFIPMRASE